MITLTSQDRATLQWLKTCCGHLRTQFKRRRKHTQPGNFSQAELDVLEAISTIQLATEVLLHGKGDKQC
jgi:hypothetical protein